MTAGSVFCPLLLGGFAAQVPVPDPGAVDPHGVFLEDELVSGFLPEAPTSADEPRESACHIMKSPLVFNIRVGY